MNIYKVLPDLKKTRHLALWHKALRSQWSAVDLTGISPSASPADASRTSCRGFSLRC